VHQDQFSQVNFQPAIVTEFILDRDYPTQQIRKALSFTSSALRKQLKSAMARKQQSTPQYAYQKTAVKETSLQCIAHTD